MTLEGAYVLPVVEGNSIGAAFLDEEMPEAWASKENANGAQIGSEAVNIVLVVSREGEQSATATAARVEYTVAGSTYAATNTTEYLLDDNCQ